MTASVAGHRLRRAAVASVATMALFGLSACGSDDSGAKASDGSSSAVSSTGTSSSDDSSSSDTSASSPSKPAAGSDVSASDMAAVFSTAFAKATSAHVKFESTGGSLGGLSAEGDASYQQPISIAMTMTLPQMGQADVRLVDNVFYMKLPMLGDKFIKFPLDDPNSPLGSLGSTFSNQLDPAQLVKTLQGAIDKATYVGNEDVDGEKLDHYTLTVDGQKMLQSYGSAVPSAGAAALPKSLTYDMWFDSDGLFRQMKIDLGSSGSFTGTFSDWGKPVTVQAPPASQVTDMPALPSSVPSS